MVSVAVGPALSWGFVVGMPVPLVKVVVVILMLEVLLQGCRC